MPSPCRAAIQPLRASSPRARNFEAAPKLRASRILCQGRLFSHAMRVRLTRTSCRRMECEKSARRALVDEETDVFLRRACETALDRAVSRAVDYCGHVDNVWATAK